ncbi:MAG: ribulose-phosphate 3-epimerase [Bryobacteraceae bacterium]
MASWNDLPRERLLADVSLWSADLSRLGDSIEAVDWFADSYHFDVADAHFTPTLLFFPDLLAALRPATARPFHVHLMAEKPTALIPAFVEAGADVITIHAENGDTEIHGALEMISAAGKQAGLALSLETPVDASSPWLRDIDVLLLLGTRLGVKGQGLDAAAVGRMRQASALLQSYGRRDAVRLVADGAIRTETVPLLHAAGADVIVPGSLVFGSPAIASLFEWLHGLPGEAV